MLSGVTIFCFAASYSVVLILEISRLLFRSGIRGAIMLGFAAAGLFAHSIYLYDRAALSPMAPLSSMRDLLLVAAWILVAVYLYLIYYHPRVAFGLFLLPLVLALLGVAAWKAGSEPAVPEAAAQIWGLKAAQIWLLIHFVSILLAVVAVLVGFVAGMMYLHQASRLKRKLPPLRGFWLPSLEWLQRSNGRAVVIALIMMGIGLMTGSILNQIAAPPGAGRMPWHDPIVLSTLVTFLSLLVAVTFAAFYHPARQGRKVAYLTVVTFLFLMLALAVAVGLFLRTQHGALRAAGRAPSDAAAAPRGGTP
jgi:ABC-type transport system involved in cytochrome c biogenesis permease subunit